MQGVKNQAVAWDLVSELLWSVSDSVSDARWRYATIPSLATCRGIYKRTLGLMGRFIAAVRLILKVTA